MALQIRYIPEEGTLRSVGNAPNGIIGISAGDGKAQVMVDSTFIPSGIGQHVTERTPEENDRVTTTVEVDEVVEGCETVDELWRLAGMAIGNAEGVIRVCAPERDFDTIRATVDVLEAVLLAIEVEVRERLQ